MASHYWDAFLALDGACDTARLHGVRREEVEHAYGTWVTLLEQACILDDASAAVAKLFEKSQADTAVLSALDGWADKYLYDPNSPVRNEDLYLPWVRARAASPLRQAADSMIAHGCVNAYTLDGGQTGSILIGGQLINPVQFGAEREMSDIYYFATIFTDPFFIIRI